MKRRSIKYIGLVLLCVAGCMFVAACGQDKGSAVRNDEGSVLSGETEAKDVEKSTDPADYELVPEITLSCRMGAGEGPVLCGSRKSGTLGN